MFGPPFCQIHSLTNMAFFAKKIVHFYPCLYFAWLPSSNYPFQSSTSSSSVLFYDAIAVEYLSGLIWYVNCIHGALAHIFRMSPCALCPLWVEVGAALEFKDIAHEKNVCLLKKCLHKCLPEVKSVQPLPNVLHKRKINIHPPHFPIPWNHFPKDPTSVQLCSFVTNH